MYDMRQEANEFVGDTLAEARAKAAEFFGADESDLKVILPKENEIYGVAGRTVIVAVPKNLAARGRRSSEGSGDEDRGPRREGRRDRGDRGDRGEARGRSGGGGGRERGRGRGRDQDRDRDRDRDRDGDRDRDQDRGRGRGREERTPRETVKAEPRGAVENSKGKPKGEIGPVGEFLLGTIERMKLGSFEISEASEGDFLIYQLNGAAADALQSGDGRATDALQLIANQVAMRQSDDAPRIVVDVEGGGDEREETLARLADRAVKRARETGRSIALDPMNSRDRRAIHLAVRDEDDVATMSIGEGRYRQVLVVPEGAPEYDDAVAESSRS